MSPLVAPLATFLLFSHFAAAQVYAPDCSLIWAWTFNSINQNACTVAAYLMSTCNGGSFTIDALKPGYSYTGPSGVDDSNMCKCNTITYSLVSACDACQGADWTSWSVFSSNCTKTMPPSSFPNSIPAGTRVPQWALLDVTSENNWNVNKSISAGDTPELASGATPGASGTSGRGATASGTRAQSPTGTDASSSSTTKPASSSSAKKSSSNLGVIVGGAVGGVAVIAVGAIVIILLLRRQRPQAPAPVATSMAPPGIGASQRPMEEIQQPLTMDDAYTASIPGSSSMPGTPVTPLAPASPATPMRLYDPNDPTTFPGGYQGVPQSPAMPMAAQGSVPSLNGTGNSLATMQTSRQQGYHGLPTV
jgi:hypothetical protein